MKTFKKTFFNEKEMEKEKPQTKPKVEETNENDTASSFFDMIE